MKKLLLIIFLSTPLFSTTAFTKINLICDEPYYFFPDLEQRVFLEIAPSKSTVFETKLSENLMKVEVVSYNDLKESESEFRWKKEGVYVRRINRTTGEYKDTVYFAFPITKKCNKVKANKFQDALNKLDKYSLKVKNERKI